MRTQRWVAIHLMLGLALLPLSACSAGGTSAADIGDAEWRLVASSVSSSDLGAAGITATFSDGLISGSGGVNGYSGECVLDDDGTIEVGEITSTLIAGSDEANAAEAAYFALLQDVASFKLENDILTLMDSGGNEILVFERGE